MNVKKISYAVLISVSIIKIASASGGCNCGCDTATDGVYIGLGVTTASENYDFNMRSVPVAAIQQQYMDLPHSNSTRNHTGTFAIGYKMRSPFFLAGEFSIALNQHEKNHLFDKDTSNHNPLEQNCANLRLQKGNDLQFLCKSGMSFDNTTPYAILGWHTRKHGFSLEYPYDLNAGDFRYANKRSMKHINPALYTDLGFLII